MPLSCHSVTSSPRRGRLSYLNLFNGFIRMDRYFHRANADWYRLLKQHASHMRSNPTEAERILWIYLKGKALGVGFKRQCIILDYIADFFCPACNLIIEIDGGYHQMSDQIESDSCRTERLESKGYHMLRFTNEQVLFTIDDVVSQIEHKIEELKNTITNVSRNKR